MRGKVGLVVVALGLGLAGPVWADDVGAQIDAARTTYGKGDALHTLSALQAAVDLLQGHLSDQFAKTMPPPPAGWEAGAASSVALDSIGGGLTVSRAYTKGDSTLNASLVIDNPSVEATVTMFRNSTQLTAQPGWSRVKVGADDAILRFDASSRAGEISILVGERALLQIEGTDINKDDVLLDAAKGWNVAALRKLLGP
jgi:hypothetical protein